MLLSVRSLLFKRVWSDNIYVYILISLKIASKPLKQQQQWTDDKKNENKRLNKNVSFDNTYIEFGCFSNNHNKTNKTRLMRQTKKLKLYVEKWEETTILYNAHHS